MASLNRTGHAERGAASTLACGSNLFRFAGALRCSWSWRSHFSAVVAAIDETILDYRHALRTPPLPSSGGQLVSRRAGTLCICSKARASTCAVDPPAGGSPASPAARILRQKKEHFSTVLDRQRQNGPHYLFHLPSLMLLSRVKVCLSTHPPPYSTHRPVTQPGRSP